MDQAESLSGPQETICVGCHLISIPRVSWCIEIVLGKMRWEVANLLV